jgi:hypothetical protein
MLPTYQYIDGISPSQFQQQVGIGAGVTGNAGGG